MRERPILFSAPMVLAILAGTKTQTRRLVKPAPGPCDHRHWRESGDTQWADLSDASRWVPHPNNPLEWYCAICGNGTVLTRNDVRALRAPAAAGDLLWVRESFAPCYFDDGSHGYRADWTPRAADVVNEPRWTPSIHMPRWASRISLDVTSVRVERLQDITGDDARAEGVTPFGDHVGSLYPLVTGRRESTRREAFAVLWDAINGKRAAWASNPWVWVVSFARVVPS